MIIGLISDTHGLVRAACHQALAGADLILHAGDVGSADVLVELGTIAPVEAVAGNVDGFELNLPRHVWRKAGGLSIHVSHGDEFGRPTPEALLARYSADILVYGHTHKALVHRAGSRLVVNPGAAGPRRFLFRPSLARLTIADGQVEVNIIDLGHK